MKKNFYLIVLFILSFDYLGKVPFFESNPDILLVLTWLWGFVGIIIYRGYSKNRINILSNKKYAYWFVAIMVISTLFPLSEFNQPIITSIIAQRANYSVLFLIIFLSIHPEENDIFKALKFCTYLSIILMLISIAFPSYFLAEEKLGFLQERQAEGSADLITWAPGINLLFFYFLVRVSNALQNKPNKNEVLEITILMLIIILLQNRSRLIIAVPVFLYFFTTLKSRFKPLYWFLVASVISLFSGYIITSGEALWKESVQQISDTDYNRWQALSFFILEFKSNIFTFIFGHGISASDSEYLEVLKSAQKNRLAFIADVGLFGTYFLYGISFVAIVYRFVFKALKRMQPYYLKFFALYIFLVPTIQGFGLLSSSAAITFTMFFYLIIYNSHYKQEYYLTEERVGEI